LNLITEAIEADRYPHSPRIRVLRDILAKFGAIGPVPPELAQKLRRHAPHRPLARRRHGSAIRAGARGKAAGRAKGSPAN
jgi:hypothetical protein